VIGKPKPTLFEALAAQLGTHDALVIGDRLDTDIDGAIAAGMDSLFVLTGVHGPDALVDRNVDAWPSYIAQDLRSLEGPVVRLWREGTTLQGDSEHPLVNVVMEAARGVTTHIEWRTEAPSPLIDVRGLRTGP